MIIVSQRLPSGDRSPEIVESPVWSESLAGVASGVSEAGTSPGRGRRFAVESAIGTIGSANPGFLEALEHKAAAERAREAESSCGAIELLIAVSTTWAHHRPAVNKGTSLTRLLARRLSSHEQAVLAGELTYAVSDKEAEKPATRLRQLASTLSEAEETSQADLIALQESALELAAVQVRASGNIAIGGRAGEAPEVRSTRVDELAQAISAEISAKAVDSLQRVPQSHDTVAIHFGSCLRLLSARSLIRQFDSKPSEESELETHLHDLRAAWIDLAGLEYAAVTALDQDLENPTYEERFGDLVTAVAEGAKNVLYGGRLVSRPQAFRGSKAWGAQAATLTYAVEAYVRGLREVPSGFAQAQLVILTRLVRAVAAIALIDLRKARSPSGNGHKKSLKMSDLRMRRKKK